MIERREEITGRAILIGLAISILLWVLSIKSPMNTANGVKIGNIGLPSNVVNELRKLLNP